MNALSRQLIAPTVLLVLAAQVSRPAAQAPGNPTAIPGTWATNGSDIHNKNPGFVGIGVATPGADLDVEGNLASPLSGLVSVTVGSNHVTGGGSGTLFLSELRAGDALRIGTEVFTVASIADDANLFLDSNSVSGHGSVPAFRDGDLLKVQDGDGNQRLLVDRSGNVELSGTFGVGASALSNKVDIAAENSTVPRSSALALLSQATAIGDYLGISFCQNHNEERARAGIFAISELSTGNASSLGFFTRSASDGSVLQASDERMHIDSAGHVGINTSSPTVALEVAGTLSAAVKNFRIDHPLDPYDKALVHSCIESSEMMNLYRGNVVLDELGEAVVVLPAWFEALNRDFSYQLTAIGAPAPELHVAAEIVRGRFVIAGGNPGAKVSWLVTGVRHDAYALAHPLQVEQDKGAARGTLLYPAEIEESFVAAPR